MPRKIKFTAVYATSEDSKHCLSELNTHGPTVKGWQSERNSAYPQEIILQLDRRAKLSKIQVLVHQYLISEKMELWVNSDDDISSAIGNLQWEYLGYITLSDNQSTGFKSRELKSVSVPGCIVSHIKIILNKNHLNAYNTHNQVSLIAINTIGTDAHDDDGCDEPESKFTDETVNSFLNDPEYSSPYDDLAFEMYVDMEVADIIREMEIKKHQAVKSERFEYARKLKQAMESLRSSGERLSKYELEKRHAIEVEDYDRARQKKTQMEDYRKQIYTQLSVEQLLETNGVSDKNDECSEQEIKHHVEFSPPSMLKVPKTKERAISPNASQTHPTSVSPVHHPRPKSPNIDSNGSPTNNSGNHQRTGSFRRRNKSAGAIVKSSYEAYEERTLPALRHSQTNEFLRECQLEPDIKTISKLTDREKKQAALPILVFGTDLVEKFYSKQYSDKEEGLNRLRDELRAYDASSLHTPNKTARAAIFLLHRSLRDKVFSVYSLANEVIRLFFVEFVPTRVSQAEVARSVDRLLPELLTKSGDQAARIHHMAVHTILTMADCRSVRELHQIPVHLSRPVSSSTHPRLALSRMEMVEQLIINHGISTDKQSGLTCRTLSEFGVSGLHHPAEAVRKVAERVLVHVYKVNPRLVRKQLPPDDDITRRNLLYRQLFHEFDKIDIQRKKAILERNRLIQQFSVTSNQDCISPEPVVCQPVNCTEDKLNTSCSPTPPQIITSNGDQNDTHSNDDTQNENGKIPIIVNIQNGQSDKNNSDPNSSSSVSGISSPSSVCQQENEESARKCIFCLSQNVGGTDAALNVHYWRWCPMLTRCTECSQVIEIATLNEHLLSECDKRTEFTQCATCSVAVELSKYDLHVTSCEEVPEGHLKCPLCHDNFEEGDGCWRNHLMVEGGCAKSCRTKISQKQVKIKT
ncbi:uncharacterized protein CBL_08920 [Carabus blaptoides fortunei]